ncbi:Phage regulatory protein Rha [Maribacter dokdonensis]|uniref:Rha family transcriptional regulator n=1 Tax=Maribacter dokdonensis TaxID=320912 RepID=UPI001B0F465F|nr:Rha family transcriptional regulator [Maribacter dokdonensis]CAG2532945.1 Phage regulatory protein Rha [Maribacter dokdonensis]
MSKESKRPAPSTNEQINLTERNFALSDKTITSLEISELSGKPHDALLKSIRKQEVAWQEVTGVNFYVSEYQDSSGRKLPMYQLSKAESLYISSKFNDKIRAALVMRWMFLETKQYPLSEIHKLLPVSNPKGNLPVVDIPMQFEVYKKYPLRVYYVNGVKLTLVTDLLKAHQSTTRAYKQARKINKGAMKAIKLLDFNGNTIWAVDELGRSVLVSQLEYDALLSAHQLKLGI